MCCGTLSQILYIFYLTVNFYVTVKWFSNFSENFNGNPRIQKP